MKRPTKTQWFIIAVCLIFMFFGQYFVPGFWGLESQGIAVVCIFIGTMVLYCTVDILWPTLAAIMAVITNGLYTYSEAAQLSLGNWIVSYVLFVTIMTYALRKSGFVKRAAVAMVSSSLSQKGGKWFAGIFLLATNIVGWFIDPVTCYLVMSALLEEVFAVANIKKGDKTARDLTFALLVVDCISCSATPIAHSNAALLTQTLNTDYGIEWSILNFSAYGILCSLIFLALYLVYLFFIVKMDLSMLDHMDITALKADLAPMQKKERNILIIYMAMVVLWFAPGILNLFAPSAAAFLNKLGLLFPCLLGTVLFVLCHDKEEGYKPYLDFGDGLKNGAAWSVVILTAGCMLLGSMFNNAEFGVVAAITKILSSVFNGMNSWVVIFIATAIVCVMTNFCSNTVTEILMYNLTIPLIMAGTIKGVQAMPLCAMIGMACNVAVMTPVASGHSAVFSGTGWCSAGDQFKKGIIFLVAGTLFCAFIAYPVACVFL